MSNKKDNIQSIPNTKIVNGRTVFNCTQCGDCCHIREKDKNISPQDEEAYRHYMFNKFGIIYLARLSDITINIWPEEAEKLKEEARSRGIKLDIVPKRAVYDKKAHELVILDYYINHDICPFFDKKNNFCTVYTIRPIICRSYPLLTTKNLGKCRFKLNNPSDYDNEINEAEKLESMINMQKQLIQSLIDKGEIVIPESISDIELDNIFRTARFKELKLMNKIKKI